jgi:Ran GTPase-activating protein (RanGAP) involved in mRNA processing and transport
LILIEYGIRPLVIFMVALLSVTLLSTQLDASGSDELETFFKDNLQKGVLNLSGKKIGDKGLTILLKQEFLKDLKKIDLRYNEISPVGAKMLANTITFKKLKTLILKHNFFSDEGAIALAQSNSFPKLENLQLGWNEVRDAGALALAESQNFPELKKLDLRGNFLAGQTKDVLRSSFFNLKSLRIFQSE